ncbi:DUF4397 domain-containing protein [Marinobacter arenosus]|uniref:DUF4397 domain-containing protein n=1 Tax=Marinobacter arenosus TaxID=2856822 RepID=UPI001C4B66EC|nr:DUF4397 domain-containing protein [Marinobacter arenosus]MBW0148930.1 DUF4397 domain-containing protein [Marinobacter arenosus]
MNTRLALPLVVAGSVLLTGCFDDDDDPTNTSVRVVHASSDAPAVNVRLNDDTVVAGADFKQAAVLTPRAGNASIAVDGVLPGGDTATVIEADAALRFDTSYDVIAVGKVGDQTIEPLILEDDGNRESADSVRLRVAHLSPDAQAAAAGPVDVYVTAAGADLPAEATFTFAFKESVGPLEVPAGDYQIRVTPSGADTVVYDSGTVPLPAGADLLIGAVDNTGANGDAGPISLIVLNGGDVSEIYSQDQNAGVRVVHASSNAPNVDVFVDGQATALADIPFGSVAPEAVLDGYAALPAGERRIQVAAAGTGLDGGLVVIDESPTLVNGQGYTALAVGQLENIEALVVEDQVRSIATQASLRLIHASTAAGNVDIYLVPGTQDGIGNSAPALSDVPFKAVTDYLAVAEGTYNVYIAPTGTGTAAITAEGVELSAGEVYTAVARDADPTNGEPALTELGLILFDDFVGEI